jgi:hypothetical protein
VSQTFQGLRHDVSGARERWGITEVFWMYMYELGARERWGITEVFWMYMYELEVFRMYMYE